MSARDHSYPTIVLGGSGYVAGEFLRLIDAHPKLTLSGAVSTSQAGEPIAKTFPHLAPAYPDQPFVSIEATLEGLGGAPHWLVLSAAPHGASAQLVQQLLAAAGLADEFYVSAITGSTGAGRTPRETTHHPVRQSNFFAYQALKHRHQPEVRALVKALTGRDIRLRFVPHSGPFARGIHATIFAQPKDRVTPAQVHDALHEFYRGAQFVRVETEPPRLKDIVATNYAALHGTVQDDAIAVFGVADNLLKGAAGGCIQWANRLLGLPESTGLAAPAAGWL